MTCHFKNANYTLNIPGLVATLFRGFIILSIFFGGKSIFAQEETPESKQIDSLVMVLSITELQDQKSDILHQIAEIYLNTNCERSIEYGELALNVAQKAGYTTGIVNGYEILGDNAIVCEINYIKALSYFSKSMALTIEMEDKLKEMELLVKSAFAEFKLERYNAAIAYLDRAREIAEEYGKSEDVIGIYAFLGEVYFEKGDITRGFDLLEYVLENEYKLGPGEMRPEILMTIGRYHSLMGDKEMALEYNEKALKLYMNDGDRRGLSYNYAKIGEVYLQFGEFRNAIDFGKIGLDLASDREHSLEQVENYQLLAAAYDSIEDYENSAYYHKAYYAFKDSLYKKLLSEQTSEFESQFQSILAEKENAEAQSELRTRELESENDALFIRFAVTALAATLLFLVLLYLRLRNTNKLNTKLELQQHELKKLSIVAANIDQMVMIVGKDDRIEWVNSAFEKKFGYLKFEASGRKPNELLAGNATDREKVQEINQKIFEEKVGYQTTIVQYAKDRTAYFTRLLFSPILNDTEELERYVVISQDITEEQKVAEQLRELSLVASNTTNSIVIFNKDKKIMWVNDSFTKISGFKAGSVFGKGPLDIYNGPLLSDSEKRKLINRYDSGKTFTLECESFNRITNKNYWISMSVTPVFSDEGKLQKYISVATDITDLKELEDQYERLVEDSSDMIYETDFTGRFVFVNDVMANVTGYTKEELKQVYFLDLIRDDHRHEVEEFYKNQMQEREETSYIEFPALTRNKEVIWVGQLARMKLNETNNHILGFSVITRDITEKKKAENELKKTYENANLLSQIGMQITSTHSVIDIIEQVYGNINKLMDANVFGIAIPNKVHDKLTFPRIIERGEPLSDMEFDMFDDTRLGVICFKEGREIIIDDFHEQINEYVPNVDEIAPVAGDVAVSIIYLPLILKGKTIGVITVQSFNRYAYDEYQLSLVRSLASFVAIAMENATLYEVMEEKILERTKEVILSKEELEVNYFNTRLLSEIGQLVSSTFKLDEILDELYERVTRLMKADVLGILTIDEEENVIRSTYYIEKGEKYPELVVDMDDERSYAAWCVRNNSEVLINDHKEEYSKYIKELNLMQGDMPQSLIFYPLIVENKIIGVITIQSYEKEAYQPYHLDILKTLASYVGTTLDNAMLYDTLETKVKERTEELEQKNNDITASINYAKRLQKGILPAKSFMRQLLPESFVYFGPKDIVSGDFYWVDRTQSKILIAVVDCTGHGVPGAMMSIIGRNLLDQAVNEKGITIPAQILNFLQVGLSVAFGQTGERKADLFDGMDLALCSVDLKTNMLEFAGANNSLYIIQEGELIEVKGNKIGISAEFEVSEPYTNVEMEIQKGDIIYLTSDGFPDQFGGPKYKKFTYRRMQELFLEIHKEDMGTQYDRIKGAIQDWKGDADQTDDICVMGVRF